MKKIQLAEADLTSTCCWESRWYATGVYQLERSVWHVDSVPKIVHAPTTHASSVAAPPKSAVEALMSPHLSTLHKAM